MMWVYAIVVIGGILFSMYLMILSPSMHWIGKKIETIDSVDNLAEIVRTNAIILKTLQMRQITDHTNMLANMQELGGMVSGVMTVVTNNERIRNEEASRLRDDLGHLGKHMSNIYARLEGLDSYTATNTAMNELLLSRLNGVESNSSTALSDLRSQFAMLRRATSNDLRLVEKVVPAAATTNIEQHLAAMREQIIRDVNNIIANSKVSVAPTNPADDHIVVSMLPDQSPSKKAAGKTPKPTRKEVAAEKTDGYYYVTNYIVVPPQKVAEIPHAHGVQIQAMFMEQDAGWWETLPGNPEKGEPYKVLSSREEQMEALRVMVVRWSKKAPPHPKLVYSLKDYAVSWPDAPSTNPTHTQAGVRK
jgi:hypothetical protein